VATAVLGDSSAIEVRYISASERGPTIQSGEVDLLVRTVTWTTSTCAHCNVDNVARCPVG